MKRKTSLTLHLVIKSGEHPELHFQEKFAVSTMEEALLAEGFNVQNNLAV